MALSLVSVFSLHFLLLWVMPATTTSMKIFSKHFSPHWVPSAELQSLISQRANFITWIFCGLLKYDITNSPYFLPFLSLSQLPLESSSTTVNFPSPSISGLWPLFLQNFSHLHSSHIWLWLNCLYFLCTASVPVSLSSRLSLIHSHLPPAAVG